MEDGVLALVGADEGIWYFNISEIVSAVVEEVEVKSDSELDMEEFIEASHKIMQEGRDNATKEGMKKAGY